MLVFIRLLLFFDLGILMLIVVGFNRCSKLLGVLLFGVGVRLRIFGINNKNILCGFLWF